MRRFVFAQQRRFAARDYISLDERRPGCAQPAGLADPQNMVQVAQAPGGLFDIGLQVRVMKALMTLLLLEPFGFGKLQRVETARELFFELPEQLAVAIDMT